MVIEIGDLGLNRLITLAIANRVLGMLIMAIDNWVMSAENAKRLFFFFLL